MSWLWTSPASVELTVPRGHRAYLEGPRVGALWGRVYPAAADADRRAAAEFVATAHAAFAAARTGSHAVAVTGTGLLATLVGDLLPPGGERPEVVIDTTGSPEEIRLAVATLPRLGCLVLAGPPSVTELDLATYRDIHVRGLTVIGVPWAPSTGRPGEDEAIDAALEVLRPDGLWCVVSGEPT